MDEFRLLSVWPASSTESPVIADLFVERLKSPHVHYDALSYTWGDSSSIAVIVVNGVKIPVTKNLRLALQNLRQRSQSSGEPIRIWVDSICINQHNMAERNEQVAQMGKIYSQARCVAVWLGDASGTSKAAMQLLNECYKLKRDNEVIRRVVSDETASYLGYFNACKGRRLRKTIALGDPNPELLFTDGVILDVVKVAVHLEEGEEKRKRAFQRMDPGSMGPRPGDKSQLQAFFETMIFDNITLHSGNRSERLIRKENLKRLAVGFLHEVNTFHHENDVNQRVNGKSLKQLEVFHSDFFKSAFYEYRRLDATDPEALRWRREEYKLRTEEVTNGSLTSLFSTKGRYIGRGLTSVKKGDLVAILLGCRLPVVLRKSIKRAAYELISPCYVSGIMNGEVMKDLIFEDFLKEDHASSLKVERLRLV
ncbi:Heterokaryon incompatibility protein 6, OR allele [Colletotrichum tropicale]|nr:Heterokaryon incompatibility protein 6, OR allele [Colletotrichum tropicale]